MVSQNVVSSLRNGILPNQRWAGFLQLICFSEKYDLECMRFSELVRLLEREGFRLVKEKGSIRYYARTGHPRLIRVDFHGAKEIPTGTCHAILKAAGIKRKEK